MNSRGASALKKPILTSGLRLVYYRPMGAGLRRTCAQVFQACLAKPLVTDKAQRREVARQCLLQTLQCLLKEDSAFADVRVDVLEPDNTTGDVATLAFANGNATRICLLKKVSSTDVIRRGILAMDRMAQPASTWQHTLLVMPGLEIERPMFLGKIVTICSLDFTMLHHALQAQLPAQR